MRPSSFDFLKKTVYEPALRHLEDFERQFILAPEEAGKSLREFWESFTKIALQSVEMQRAYKLYLSKPLPSGEQRRDVPGNRMNFLFSQSAFWPGKDQSPISKNYSYIDHLGSKHTFSRFEEGYVHKPEDLELRYYFRNYAHAFHHIYDAGRDVPHYRVSFYHTLDYIKKLQAYLIHILGLKNIVPTNVWDMPLSLNNGQTVFYLDQKLELGAAPQLLDCCYAFSGILYYDKETPVSYPAVIQMFSKQSTSLTKEQLTRTATAYNSTRHSKFGEALREVRVLSGYLGDAEYYTLAYVFEATPQALTEQLLESISMEGRLIVCREIAQIISALHNAKTAIYHRLLNHKCIYLCQNIDSDIPWYPSIVGFEFAKINTEQIHSAFLDYGQIDKLRLPDTALYIPFGWESSAAKFGNLVDIYSMGILFLNILTGKFRHPFTVDENHTIKQAFDYIRTALKDVPEEIRELVIKMLDPLGVRRPDARTVLRVLSEIC